MFWDSVYVSFVGGYKRVSILNLFRPNYPFPCVFRQAIEIIVRPPTTRERLRSRRGCSYRTTNYSAGLVIRYGSPIMMWRKACCALDGVVNGTRLSM